MKDARRRAARPASFAFGRGLRTVAAPLSPRSGDERFSAGRMPDSADERRPAEWPLSREAAPTAVSLGPTSARRVQPASLAREPGLNDVIRRGAGRIRSAPPWPFVSSSTSDTDLSTLIPIPSGAMCPSSGLTAVTPCETCRSICDARAHRERRYDLSTDRLSNGPTFPTLRRSRSPSSSTAYRSVLPIPRCSASLRGECLT